MQAFLFYINKIAYLFRFYLPMAILLLAGCRSSKEVSPETRSPIFLVPASYQGTLTVVFGQKCGIKPELENGVPLFRFPKDGILILKEKESYYNRVSAAYYFVDSTDSRQEITQVIHLWPNWTTDRNGSKKYLDKGNTTLEKYRRNQPVFVIRGMSVQYLEPILIKNGKTINGEEAGFAQMQYSVYANGVIDTTGLMSKIGEDQVVKSRVRACKERNAAGTKSISRRG